MMKFVAALSIVFSLLAGSAHAGEKIRIAGSGGMIPLLNELTKAFVAENKQSEVEVNQKSLQSAGGIMGVAEGRLDIGLANRPFKDEEKSLGLQSVEIAKVAVVIGINKSESIREISGENLCRIYEGKVSDWKELGGAPGKIVALTKSEKDATKETVRKNLGCFRDLKEPASVMVIPTSPETARALSNRPNAIGFVDSVTVDDSKGAIIPLKLDGVAPSAENVKSGRYKLVQTYRFVTKGAPSGRVKDFIDFVKSPKGTRILEANIAVPVR